MPIHDWTRVTPGIFHHFHHEWISTLCRALNSTVLPAEYYALAEQIAGGLGPDVLTLASGNRPGGEGEGPRGDTTLAEAPPRVRFTARSETESYAARRSRVAVRHASNDEVVAVVEIVSPGNKSSRHALRSFVDKSLELLAAGVHVLMIDLFPPGPRDPNGIHGAIWAELEDDAFTLPPHEPLTLVSYSAGLVTQAFIEPVAVGRELPEMPLFLTAERYVSAPLEESYAAAFESVPARWREALE
mgnify:CR=1 FL=1